MSNSITGLSSPAALFAAEAARLRATMASSAGAATTTQGVGAGNFGQALQGALEKVNGAQNQAQDLAAQFQLGNPKVSLEEMMIASQTANIGFQTLVQTRNRLVSAYNEIMNMPV